MSAQVSRRQFLTGSAAATLGLAFAGGLAGCANSTQVTTEAPAAEELEKGTEAAAAATEDAATTSGNEVRRHAALLNPQEKLPAVENTTCPNLFTPWKFGSLELPNRIVKSAAGYIGVTSMGIDAPLFLDYYGKILGSNGAGLVYCDDFVELYDHFKAIPDVGKDADWTEEQLQNFTNAVHENGGRIGYQLATMGLVYSGFEPDPTAIFQTSTCMDMTAQEIQDLIADTIKAAATCKRVGFDAVEINAAGENTGETFMSRSRNFRDDEYGPQNFENRTRFVCDIVRGIKAECGDDFPVQVLINVLEENDKAIGDNDLFTTLEENIEMAKLIEEAGADSLHLRLGPQGMHVAEFAGDLYFCGTGIEGTTGYGTQFDFQRHWEGMFKTDQSGLGLVSRAAAEIKKNVGIPCGCVTYMDPAIDPDFFDGLIANGDLDFILMNRPLNVDPDYIHKLEEGRLDEIRPCTRCLHCHWDADENGEITFGCRTYAPHPFQQVTQQVTGGYFLTPAETAKNVMVVGAGPAGMEAAIVAAERGHNVTLYEKKGYLGGTMVYANDVKGQHENLDRLISFYTRQLELQGVEVVTGQEVDADFIAAQAPDEVIWAVGGTRTDSGFASTAGTEVVPIDDFPGATMADDVVIYGSNAQAIDLAMNITAQGKHVQIVNPGIALRFGDGHSFWVKNYTQPTMKSLGVRFFSECEVTEIGDGEVIITRAGGGVLKLACGTFIDALDCTPTPAPVDSAIVVGDAAKPWNIEKAICAGHEAGRTV